MKSASAESRLTEPADARVERSQASLLSLRGICKTWGDLQVLDDVDLDLAPGDRAWLGGRNGVGKTTLLRIAGALILADAGEVTLRGLDAESNRREFHRRLGFLSAGNTGLYARLTVRDNLRFWARISYIPPERRPEALERALTRFGLDELAGRRVDRLSMGQRQRVRLAMCFLHDPQVLLLDEPHTSLDDDALAVLSRSLDDHAAGGGAAIICAPSREHLGSIHLDAAYVIDSARLRRA